MLLIKRRGRGRPILAPTGVNIVGGQMVAAVVQLLWATPHPVDRGGLPVLVGHTRTQEVCFFVSDLTSRKASKIQRPRKGSKLLGWHWRYGITPPSILSTHVTDTESYTYYFRYLSSQAPLFSVSPPTGRGNRRKDVSSSLPQT